MSEENSGAPSRAPHEAQGQEQALVWRPIESAPKDGTVIWAVFHPDIYPRVRPGREDLQAWNGRQVPLRHPGVYEERGQRWDHGWNLGAPVGHGGFPDEWIAGWLPLPPPPSAAGHIPSELAQDGARTAGER